LETDNAVAACQQRRPNLFDDALEAMSRTDAETSLVWVPSHIGIEGNEKADRLANAALDSDNVELDIGLELGDEFSAVDRFVLEKWQKDWENETTGAFYRRLEPRVARREVLRFGSRAAETMALRLRFGKCALNATSTGDGPAFFAGMLERIGDRRQKAVRHARAAAHAGISAR
jgi:hypothetical protein